MLVLVTYDVSTRAPEGPKRLQRIAKICKNFGQRVQNSVFECLVTPAQWIDLKNQLTKTAEPDEDSLRFYFLGSDANHRVEHWGAKPSVDLDGPLVI